MKKILIATLVGSVFALSSCGNSETDSKQAANEENKTKFDSSSLQDDTKFAVAAADGGMMEVQLGKLALQNGSNGSVKEFARQMIEDHGKGGDELKALAQSKNITLPTALSNKNQDDYNGLAKKQGADFDKAYASYMINDHKEDIDEFQKEADKGKDNDLKQWATKTIPMLRHHLGMAQAADSVVRKK